MALSKGSLDSALPHGTDTRNFNRRDCPPDNSLVSVDLRTDEISSTGGHRFFAPFYADKEPLALYPGAPNLGMTRGLHNSIVPMFIEGI